MDKTESRARRADPELTGRMVRTAIRDAQERMADRVLTEIRASGVPTGHAVPMAHLGRLDPPVSPVQPARRDRLAYLDRAALRANGARRVSRVLRGILARLVRRANL